MVDLRTLLVLVAVADVMVAIVLWMGAGRRMRHGVAAWIASLLARALAVAILALGLQPQAGGVPDAPAGPPPSITPQGPAPPPHPARPLPPWGPGPPTARPPAPRP